MSDVAAWAATLERCQQTSERLRLEEQRRRYGTFLDSKREVVQLYMLFVLCGVVVEPLLRNHDDAYSAAT
jgi:hypothetical protein